MNINQLIYFCEVYETMNMTKASENLYVTQPAISLAILELERELKRKLFIRHNNKLERNEVADFLYPRAKKLIEQLNKLRVDTTNYHVNAPLKIVVPPMIGELLFPALLKIASDLNLKLEITETASKDAIHLVENNKVDFGFVIFNDEFEYPLPNTPITKQRLLFTVHKDHHLAHKSEISISDLNNERIIIMKEDSFQNSYLNKQFKNKKITPKVVLTSNQISTIKKLIMLKDTGAFIMEDLIDEKEFIGIPLKNSVTLDIRVVWNDELKMSNNLKLILGKITNIENI